MPAPSGLEIERKFLVERVPDGLLAGERIEQGYLAIAEDGVEVRLRRRAGRATLTVKSGPAHVRTEVELAIEGHHFESLWPLTAGRRITKTRHLLELGHGLVAEIDVYDPPHGGLLVAEIEFASTDDSDRFVPPGWLGAEVTGDSRYANQSLALAGARA
jgi:CYTH domain-containing protein